MPVCVAFLQGVLTVPVGCLDLSAECARGASARPGQAGAQETLRPGTVACQDTKFDRQKGPKGPFCGQIWSAFGKKSPMSRVWEGGV